MQAVALNGQTWLICGGRDFDGHATFRDVMDRLMSNFGCPSKIVHGGARGADAMAADFGSRMAIATVAVLPDWTRGKSAGPLRNQRMIDEHKPNLVIAFPGGRGTADMMRRAKAAKIDLVEVQQKTG